MENTLQSWEKKLIWRVRLRDLQSLDCHNLLSPKVYLLQTLQVLLWYVLQNGTQLSICRFPWHKFLHLWDGLSSRWRNWGGFLSQGWRCRAVSRRVMVQSCLECCHSLGSEVHYELDQGSLPWSGCVHHWEWYQWQGRFTGIKLDYTCFFCKVGKPGWFAKDLLLQTLHKPATEVNITGWCTSEGILCLVLAGQLWVGLWLHWKVWTNKSELYWSKQDKNTKTIFQIFQQAHQAKWIFRIWLFLLTVYTFDSINWKFYLSDRLSRQGFGSIHILWMFDTKTVLWWIALGINLQHWIRNNLQFLLVAYLFRNIGSWTRLWGSVSCRVISFSQRVCRLLFLDQVDIAWLVNDWLFLHLFSNNAYFIGSRSRYNCSFVLLGPSSQAIGRRLLDSRDRVSIGSRTQPCPWSLLCLHPKWVAWLCPPCPLISCVWVVGTWWGGGELL